MGFSVAPWPGGPGGAMPPLLLRAVGKLPMLSEIVGKLSRLSEIVKVVDGGEGGEDLKCCRPEKCLVCRKKFSVCRKSTALAPPPQKKHGSHGATGGSGAKYISLNPLSFPSYNNIKIR